MLSCVYTVDVKICLLVYKQHKQQVFSPARRPVPRVDDPFGFGSLYTSPLIV